MDALSQLNEHFLSCNICTEIFKDPCTIGCQHTFCRVCLTKFTKTRIDAITAESILCPNCNQMTRVPRPQEPVDQWCHQFKPSFLIQGLLDTFTSQGSSDPVEHCCFACQQIGKTTHGKSVCVDCDIMFCEACAIIHVAAPNGRDHVISPLGAESTARLKNRKVMCKEHNCLVEFYCKDCQKAVCNKCCIVYHRKCNSVVTLDSMIPEMKKVLQQNFVEINSQIERTVNNLESKRSEVEDINRHNSSLQSEIKRVSQQARDLIRRKEKKLLDELEKHNEKQTANPKSQIKSSEMYLQKYQQFREFIKQVLKSNSPMDLYDMYALCQSGEITAGIQRNDNQREKHVLFEEQLDLDQLDKILQLGHLKIAEDKSNLQDTPKLRSPVRTGTAVPVLLSSVRSGTKSLELPSSVSTGIKAPKLLSTVNAGKKSPLRVSTVSTKARDDRASQYATDIEVMNIGGIDTLVVVDFVNNNVKSCYTTGGKSHCTSLKLDKSPFTVARISKDRVAVSYDSHNRIELIKLNPDPVRISSIKTKKKYISLVSLSDTTMAAGSVDPPSIDVLDLSGRVVRSVKTSSGKQLIQCPRYMRTTSQGHIVVTDDGSWSVYCVTHQGDVLFTYKLTKKVVWYMWWSHNYRHWFCYRC